MDAIVKSNTPFYSELHDVIRTVIETEGDGDLFLVIGSDARALSECEAGSHLEIESSMRVTMTDNRDAWVVDRAHLV